MVRFLILAVLISSCGSVATLSSGKTTAPELSTPKNIPAPITGKLNLKRALEYLEKHHPQIVANRFGIDAAAFEANQAARIPNPKLGVAYKNKFSETPMYEVMLSQTIELGGKRNARKAVAAARAELSKVSFEASILELKSNLKMVYLKLAVMRTRASTFERKLEIANETLKITQNDHAAGRTDLSELLEAKAAAAQVRAQYAAISSAVTGLANEAKLSAGLDLTAKIEIDTDDILNLGDENLAMPFDEFDLKQNNKIKIAKSQLGIKKAATSLARSKRIGNLNVFGMSGISAETGDDMSVGAGLNIELPIFDLNTGNIKAAEARFNTALAELKAKELTEQIALSRLRAKFEGAVAELKVLKQDALLAVEEAHKFAVSEHQAGRISKATYLRKVNMVYDLRLKILDAYYSYASAVIELNLLVGK